MTLPYLTLSGSARARGHAHGEELREVIAQGIDRWRAHLGERIDPDTALTSVVTDTEFLATAERETPDLVEEVRGIAEGANQSFDTMFAWQLIDEVWWHVDEMLGDLSAHERCTAFAVTTGERGMVGQTQDLHRHLDGLQTMLRYAQDDGFEILAPSVAGLLALNGVNSAGFAATITTLSQLAHSPAGLPSGFIVPRLLRCRSVAEAMSFLRTTPVASGNSFLFGTAQESGGVEVSAEAVVDLGDSGRLLHTNHALVAEPTFQYVRFDGSVDRLAQLEEGLRHDVTIDKLQTIYRTPPVCQSRAADSAVVSIGTMFFELADEPLCHYAPGPLDTDELVTYRFSTDPSEQ